MVLMAMPVKEGTGLRQYERFDDFSEVTTPPCRQGFRIIFGKGGKLEPEKFVDIQGPRPIAIIKALVLIHVESGIDVTVFTQELAPEIVAVPADQGIVEVKQGYFHVAFHTFQNPRSRKAWYCTEQ